MFEQLVIRLLTHCPQVHTVVLSELLLLLLPFAFCFCFAFAVSEFLLILSISSAYLWLHRLMDVEVLLDVFDNSLVGTDFLFIYHILVLGRALVGFRAGIPICPSASLGSEELCSEW